MAAKYYIQHTVDGRKTLTKRSTKQGRKQLPPEIKAVRVNITLTPQAHERGKKIAADGGLTFSAWIERQIYTH